jgi:hypothetical protein
VRFEGKTDRAGADLGAEFRAAGDAELFLEDIELRDGSCHVRRDLGLRFLRSVAESLVRGLLCALRGLEHHGDAFVDRRNFGEEVREHLRHGSLLQFGEALHQLVLGCREGHLDSWFLRRHRVVLSKACGTHQRKCTTPASRSQNRPPWGVRERTAFD